MLVVHPGYDVAPGWEQRPAALAHKDVSDVAVDAEDRVYLLARRASRVIVYDRDGTWIRSWGEGVLSADPHGITIAGDRVYIVDRADQTVRVFTLDGQQVLVIGTPGVRSQTGANWSLRSLHAVIESTTGGPPFNDPTAVAVAPDGELYVADGYGNARVHRFAPDGSLLQSWGAPGGAPGQFRVPHCICFDTEDRLLVGDRENDRIQVFSRDGTYVREYRDVHKPAGIAVDPDGLIYVSETAWLAGDFRWSSGTATDGLPSRVSVLSPDGEALVRFGHDVAPAEPGGFVAAHGVALDSRGDLYVAEVAYSLGVVRGISIPPGKADIQKFARR